MKWIKLTVHHTAQVQVLIKRHHSCLPYSKTDIIATIQVHHGTRLVKIFKLRQSSKQPTLPETNIAPATWWCFLNYLPFSGCHVFRCRAQKTSLANLGLGTIQESSSLCQNLQGNDISDMHRIAIKIGWSCWLLLMFFESTASHVRWLLCAQFPQSKVQPVPKFLRTFFLLYHKVVLGNSQRWIEGYYRWKNSSFSTSPVKRSQRTEVSKKVPTKVSPRFGSL